MGLTLQEVLLRALKKLDNASFKRFIEKLSAQIVREEYKKISKDDLTGKNPEQVAGLINLYYSYAYGAEVTLNVLEDIGQKKVREELQQDLREVDVSGHGLGTAMFTDRVNFIDKHRSDLIKRITDVDPVLRDLRDQGVLTEQQYNEVMEKTTSQEKMEDLCDIIRYREQTQKYTAYRVLRKYKEEVLENLEMEDRRRRNIYWCFSGHVVDRNRSYLINDIKEVQPVLEDLRSHHLLTEEQYKDLQVMMTPKEKMRHLFDIFFLQSDTVKDQFYISLWRYNFTVINKLEKAEKLGKRPKAGGHFIDRHKEELIIGIRNVHEVIYDLYYRNLLTREQFDHLLKISETKEQMRRLYDIISDWNEDDKQKVYLSLYKYNRWIIRDLKKCEDSSTLEKSGDHFIDRHKEQLITGIREVYWVIYDLYCRNLLTREQFDHLLKISDTEDKMRRLYDIISDWGDFDKEEVYLSLYKYNPWIFQYLKMCGYSSTLENSGDHFIDRNKEELITEIREVHPVIRDLHHKDLLTAEQKDDLLKISDTEEQMRHLYDIISDWDEDYKQEVYLSLYKYNPGIIQYLKQREDSLTLENKTFPEDVTVKGGDINVGTSTLSTISDQQSDDVSKPFALMEIEKDIQSSSSESSKDTEESQTSLEEVTADNIICKLCGEDQGEEEVVSSTVGSMYRLELKSPGLYRCQKTGIKFLVKDPVIIEYKLDSWSNHLKDIPDNSYEILGPLFNIQTSGEPGAVSAVYLPHFLCLKAYSEDKALIKCAHFRDGNMTLETPTQIKPFYITLENPTFSCLGPILSLRKKKTPIHGSVLIYFTILCPGDPDEKHRIHLYVLPYDTNAEEILDNENKKFGFQRIKKPEHTNDTVYTKVKYIVTGHPGVSARPKALKFQSQPYQFTEIQLQEKVADISLNVCEENSEDPAWDAHLTQHDIRHITQSQSWLTFHEVADAGPLLEHFVDRHREALIQRTSNISPVLDNLLKERLLTLEQYDTLRGMTPHQEAMRQLYVYMKIWGQSDKEKFYKALKTHNEPLIRDLENPVIL